MIKNEIAEMIAWRTNLTRRQASDAVTQFIEIVQDGLMAGRRIELKGFACLSPTMHKPRVYANPAKSGDKVKVPARIKIKFKASPGFIQILNNGNGSPIA